MTRRSLEDIWVQASSHVEANLNPIYKRLRDERKQKRLDHLMDVIDTFAEMRHTQGHWTYNLKSHEARNAVIAALKGE